MEDQCEKIATPNRQTYNKAYYTQKYQGAPILTLAPHPFDEVYNGFLDF
jgi:hypothetical protein